MRYVALSTALGALVVATAPPASATNLYTSNFGSGPGDGKAGWEVYTPYAQVPTAIGYLIGGARFEIASPVASQFATLTFQLIGQRNVYGLNVPGKEADTFYLGINGAEILSANFGLTGGEDHIITDNSGGATVTKPTFGRTITVPFTLLYAGADPNNPVLNVFNFSYAGLTKSDSDAYLIDNVSIDYERGYIPAAPAPEPATWALMIAGLGLAGQALRQRVRLGASIDDDARRGTSS